MSYLVVQRHLIDVIAHVCLSAAVYARHYVCEITLLRPSMRDRTQDNLRVVTHTFSGGYSTNVYRLSDLELGEATQGYRRFW